MFWTSKFARAAGFLFAAVSVLVQGSPAVAQFNSLDLFDRTTAIVTEQFYDRTFRGLPWPRLVEAARQQLGPTSADEELQKGINDLLLNLSASHTGFYSSSDQEFWALKSIFAGRTEAYPFPQVSAYFERLGTSWFVKSVFPGGVAEAAGLLPGDEVISVAGNSFRPVESFSNAQRVEMLVRRRRGGHKISFILEPRLESMQEAMLRGTELSFKVVSVGGAKVAYFHLWSGTHPKFKDALKDAAKKAQKQSDAMILDLRDGFGGAGPEYIEPFFDQELQGLRLQAIFSKPLVVLINDGVRSGKEWITFLLKQRRRAVLIGSRTKGYFLAGKIFDVFPGRFLLYLAVKDLPELPALENNGVHPDIFVSSQLPYSAGDDPVFRAALKFLASEFTNH